MRKKRELQISERELVVMTNDLQEMHESSLPELREALDSFTGSVRSGLTDVAHTSTTRRRFLLGAAAGLAGVALAACGDSKNTAKSGSSTTVAGGSTSTSAAMGGSDLTGDLAVAGLAASLENLAVATYQAGIDAAKAGKLGTVPPAIVTFAQTAMKQHQDHAAAWNAVLTKSGKTAITGVDTTVKTGVVDPAFAKVTDVVGLGKLALELETVAAATYQAGIGKLQSKDAIATAATIQPVEMQHAAILHFVLGEYPVPDAFSKTDGARGGDDKIG